MRASPRGAEGRPDGEPQYAEVLLDARQSGPGREPLDLRLRGLERVAPGRDGAMVAAIMPRVVAEVLGEAASDPRALAAGRLRGGHAAEGGQRDHAS